MTRRYYWNKASLKFDCSCTMQNKTIEYLPMIFDLYVIVNNKVTCTPPCVLAHALLASSITHSCVIKDSTIVIIIN